MCCDTFVYLCTSTIWAVCTKNNATNFAYYINVLTQFLECSLAFMKKWETLFDFKVCKGQGQQISSIYDKKYALKCVLK